MKIVQIVDLLRQKMVQIPAPETEELLSQEKVLFVQDKDLILAKIVSGSRELPGAKVDNSYSFKKKISKEDFQAYEKKEENSFERVKQARDSVLKLKLNMHIFASRMSYDEKVISFFFTAENNVDFRELVKDLARMFKKRILLQRVSAQDRARIIGGVGGCGREECCAFMKFTPERASMDAVRDQGIMIKNNPRIYGPSGRLKDCFLYEWDMYRKKRKYLPHIKQSVTVKGRRGRVKGLDILGGKVKIYFDEGIIDTFDIKDVQYENKSIEPPEKPKAESKLNIDLEGIGI